MAALARPARGLAAACLALLTVAGCAGQRVKMYRGPELPDAQTATVSGFFDRDAMMVTIESVDGVPVPGQSWFRGGIYNRDTVAVIEPGVRQIGIRFWGFVGADAVQSPGRVTLRYEAAPGRRYEVRVGRDPGRSLAHPETLRRVRISGMGPYSDWIAWIIDLETGHRLRLLPIPGEQEP